MRPSPDPNPDPRYWGTMSTFKVLTQVLELTQISVEPNYRPPSRWRRHSRGREEDGVLAKAMRLAEGVRLVRLAPNIIEAEVPSESAPGVTYRVKVYVTPLDFECSCPHGEHRFNPCKHVIAAVLRLIQEFMSYAGGAPEELARLTIAEAVYEGLSRLAYLKAMVHSRYA